MSRISFPSIPNAGIPPKQKLPPKKQRIATNVVIPIPGLSQILEQTQIPIQNLVPEDLQGSSPEHGIQQAAQVQQDLTFSSIHQAVSITPVQPSHHIYPISFLSPNQLQMTYGYPIFSQISTYSENPRVEPITNAMQFSGQPGYDFLQQNYVVQKNQIHSNTYFEPIQFPSDKTARQKNQNVSSAIQNFQKNPINTYVLVNAKKNSKKPSRVTELEILASKVALEMSDPTKSFYLPTQGPEPTSNTSFNIHKFGFPKSINVIGRGTLPSIQFNIENLQNV